MQGARQDYPTYVVVRRTIKKNPNRECYRGLTYDYMRDYISRYEPEETRESVCAELEDMIQISRCHSRCKRYPVIKQWFLEKYPDVKNFWMEAFAEEETENITSFSALAADPTPDEIKGKSA